MSFSTLLQCSHCELPFNPTNKRQRFCKANCRAAANYRKSPLFIYNQGRKNAKFLARTRDQAISFDGRRSGRLNLVYSGDADSLELVLNALLASC